MLTPPASVTAFPTLTSEGGLSPPTARPWMAVSGAGPDLAPESSALDVGRTPLAPADHEDAKAMT